MICAKKAQKSKKQWNKLITIKLHVITNYITLVISLRYMLYFLTHKGMDEVSVIQVNVRNIAVGHMCRITMVTRPEIKRIAIFDKIHYFCKCTLTVYSIQCFLVGYRLCSIIHIAKCHAIIHTCPGIRKSVSRNMQIQIHANLFRQI